MNRLALSLLAASLGTFVSSVFLYATAPKDAALSEIEEELAGFQKERRDALREASSLAEDQYRQSEANRPHPRGVAEIAKQPRLTTAAVPGRFPKGV